LQSFSSSKYEYSYYEQAVALSESQSSPLLEVLGNIVT
jgi:hypothetical protein